MIIKKADFLVPVLSKRSVESPGYAVVDGVVFIIVESNGETALVPLSNVIQLNVEPKSILVNTAGAKTSTGAVAVPFRAAAKGRTGPKPAKKLSNDPQSGKDTLRSN